MVFPTVGRDYKICNIGGNSWVTGVSDDCGNYGGMVCYTNALTKEHGEQSMDKQHKCRALQ
jgi:hypothetical protein